MIRSLEAKAVLDVHGTVRPIKEMRFGSRALPSCAFATIRQNLYH